MHTDIRPDLERDLEEGEYCYIFAGGYAIHPLTDYVTDKQIVCCENIRDRLVNSRTILTITVRKKKDVA